MTTITATTTTTGEGRPAPSSYATTAREGQPQAPGRARRAGAAALLACCAALALSGCGTIASRPSNDPATSTQASESGVTVFGTVDVGVGGVRSSR
ncbi:hypothetical protein [Paracidovorax wautersii]|uniref:hypothetical protein n=1 Tax=Paracidovorax wautersii TaxID=1177982 RepID=UPI0031D39227